MASGHVNRVKRPNTWLHRPMLQNVKKVLANPEPSTHDPKRSSPTSQGVFSSDSVIVFGGEVFQQAARERRFQRDLRKVSIWRLVREALKQRCEHSILGRAQRPMIWFAFRGDNVSAYGRNSIASLQCVDDGLIGRQFKPSPWSDAQLRQPCV
jgi:hypothetical protein